MPKCLVTGATGFVGANLVRCLLNRDCAVAILVRKEADFWRLADIRDRTEVHLVEGERPEAVLKCFKAVQPNWVFNLAAFGAYSHQTDFSEIIRTNYLMTVNLVESAREVGVEAFIQAGSSSEYGPKNGPGQELDLPEPNSRYAASKVAATSYCSYAGHYLGVPAVTLRLYSVYGPWEEPTRLIPTLIMKAHQGGLPPLVHPEIKRDFVYVDDVCEAFVLAAQQAESLKGSVLNIASGKETSIREIVDSVRRMFSVGVEPVWGSMENRAWDLTKWVGNPQRAYEQLGWKATTELATGLAQTSDWIKGTGAITQRYQIR